MHNKTTACSMSAYRAGDEVLFQHAGLLSGRVERVTFAGRKVRYEVRAVLTFDVPESAVVGREADVLGEGVGANETGAACEATQAAPTATT